MVRSIGVSIEFGLQQRGQVNEGQFSSDGGRQPRTNQTLSGFIIDPLLAAINHPMFFPSLSFQVKTDFLILEFEMITTVNRRRPPSA